MHANRLRACLAEKLRLVSEGGNFIRSFFLNNHTGGGESFNGVSSQVTFEQTFPTTFHGTPPSPPPVVEE